MTRCFFTGSRENLFSANLSIKKLISQPTCPQDFAGLIPNYTDCSKFISCSYGQNTSMSCPPGTLFDSNQNICDFSYKAFCFNGQQHGRDLHGTPGIQDSQNSYYNLNTFLGVNRPPHQIDNTQNRVYATENHLTSGVNMRRDHNGRQIVVEDINRQYGINSKLDFGEGTSTCIGACTG